MPKQGSKDKPKEQYITFADNSDKWNYALDKEMTAEMMRNYATMMPAEYHPAFFKTVKTKFGGDFKSTLNGFTRRVKCSIKMLNSILTTAKNS